MKEYKIIRNYSVNGTKSETVWVIADSEEGAVEKADNGDYEDFDEHCYADRYIINQQIEKTYLD